MRLTSLYTSTLLLPLLACGPGGGTETGGSSTSGTETGTAGTTGTATGTTDPITSTGPIDTTGEPTTTTTTTTTSTTATTATSSTSSTTDPGSSSSDTGVTPVDACLSDADCHLHNDCCDCYGIPLGQVDPVCDIQCDEALCDQLAIDHAVCRFGVCTTDKLKCDANNVTCKSLPPECPDGSLPGVFDTCWSGACVPIDNCNAVPDCGLCPAGTMCIQKISKKQTWPGCEPIPVDCNGEIDCECAGTFVCTNNFNICNDLGDNQLSCGCPAC